MKTCPACQSIQSKDQFPWKDYTLVICGSCKLLYTTPLPSQDELNEYYQGFLYKKPEAREIESKLIKKTQELQRLFKKEVQSLTSNKLSFLDYGGGTGLCYKAAKDLGFDTYYSDIDQEAKAFVIDNFGLESTHDIQDLNNTEKRFDIIFSDNVIEHVPDYKAYVKNLTSKLNRGGTLLIKTPHGRNTEIFMNPFYVFKEIFKKSIKYNSFPATIRSIYRRIWHCDPPRHIYSFSKRSFELLGKSLGDDYSYTIEYYRIPGFRNTLWENYFSPDKNLALWKGFLARLIIWPWIVIEGLLYMKKHLLLSLGILSPGGIILRIQKK